MFLFRLFRDREVDQDPEVGRELGPALVAGRVLAIVEKMHIMNHYYLNVFVTTDITFLIYKKNA